MLMTTQLPQLIQFILLIRIKRSTKFPALCLTLIFGYIFCLSCSDFHLSEFNDLSLTRGLHICKIALIFDPIFLGLLGISCFFNDILKTLKITYLTNLLNIMLLSTQTLAEFWSLPSPRQIATLNITWYSQYWWMRMTSVNSNVIWRDHAYHTILEYLGLWTNSSASWVTQIIINIREI